MVENLDWYFTRCSSSLSFSLFHSPSLFTTFSLILLTNQETICHKRKKKTSKVQGKNRKCAPCTDSSESNKRQARKVHTHIETQSSFFSPPLSNLIFIRFLPIYYRDGGGTSGYTGHVIFPLPLYQGVARKYISLVKSKKESVNGPPFFFVSPSPPHFFFSLRLLLLLLGLLYVHSLEKTSLSGYFRFSPPSNPRLSLLSLSLSFTILYVPLYSSIHRLPFSPPTTNDAVDPCRARRISLRQLLFQPPSRVVALPIPSSTYQCLRSTRVATN